MQRNIQDIINFEITQAIILGSGPKEKLSVVTKLYQIAVSSGLSEDVFSKSLSDVTSSLSVPQRGEWALELGKVLRIKLR